MPKKVGTYQSNTLRALLAMLLVFCCAPTSAQIEGNPEYIDIYLDSLTRRMQQEQNNKEKLLLLETISNEHYNVDSTAKYALMELELAREVGSSQHEANALRYLAWVDFYCDNQISCNRKLFEAINIYRDIHDMEAIGQCYGLLATATAQMRDEVMADKYYREALDIFLTTGNNSRAADIYRNIAHTDIERRSLTSASTNIRHAMELDLLEMDTSRLAEDYFYLSKSAWHVAVSKEIDEAKLREALQFASISLDYSKRSESAPCEQRALSLLANIYVSMLRCNKFSNRKTLEDSCKAVLSRSYRLCDMLGYASNLTELKITEIELYTTTRNFTAAARAFSDLDTIFTNTPDASPRRYKDLWECRLHFYRTKGDLSNALSAADSVIWWITNNQNNDYVVLSSQNIARMEFEHEMQERLMAEHEKEMSYKAREEKHKAENLALTILIVLGTAFLLLLLRVIVRREETNQQLDARNRELHQKTEELFAQNETLADQRTALAIANEQITSGINYAELIQRATLPSEEMISKLFADNMVILRPLQIVSGDFYWCANVGQYQMLVAADCTGHGVPGAFMSMLGISMLNDMVSALNPKEEISPAKIFESLRATLKKDLRQRDGSTGGEDAIQDGIDMSLIVVDKENGRMKYAGAYRPIIVVDNNGNVTQTKPDRMPIGAHMRDNRAFSEHEMRIEPGYAIYMFSDGITDQFGYAPDGHECNLTEWRLKHLISKIYKLPMNVQRATFENAWDEWRTPKPNSNTDKVAPQIDDALMIGVRI